MNLQSQPKARLGHGRAQPWRGRTGHSVADGSHACTEKDAQVCMGRSDLTMSPTTKTEAQPLSCFSHKCSAHFILNLQIFFSFVLIKDRKIWEAQGTWPSFYFQLL